MTTVNNIMMAIDTFIDSRMDMILGGNPLLSLAQPIIKRGVKKQIDVYSKDIKNYLNLIADKEGNIDINGMFEEIVERFNTMDKTTFHTADMGDVTLGKGELSLEIPNPFGSPKHLTFTADDIMDFKSMITNKQNGTTFN